ncbi:hypothetical protein [Chitinophaga sancti]|uniref:Uncharacterized protein n=1 Tax=Chitinophaga sancti TaxID=1004 RepID=A0A1K1NIQ2_9BACT|nr:hypothetical protein [Chitinophaga sancti]WQD63189.1 hypothetical protein U0033_02195 [Chitinophaga sancti]WQG91185.1 hypothetical protein SR876_06720 [Chitinophaga sancti]SFW35204.1 hypothetical protein SAMN05661012_01345 [Chitinophaga sancti]
MPVDYILEMIEELGRAMRAIIARKKDQPAKALEEIKVAFNGTKFGNKAFFDALSPEELAAFLREKQVDYRAADYIVDILLEEADIARDLELERLAMDMGRESKAANQHIQSIVYNDQQLLLLRKIQVMIDYTTEIETALKIFSLKRGQQRERLKGFN